MTRRPKHRMEVVDVYHEKFQRGHDLTTVLYRCACGCGRTKTETLTGLWSKEQLA